MSCCMQIDTFVTEEKKNNNTNNLIFSGERVLLLVILDIIQINLIGSTCAVSRNDYDVTLTTRNTSLNVHELRAVDAPTVGRIRRCSCFTRQADTETATRFSNCASMQTCNTKGAHLLTLRWIIL